MLKIKVIQDLNIFNSNPIQYYMSPDPEKSLDEGSEASRLIQGFPEPGEAFIFSFM